VTPDPEKGSAGALARVPLRVLIVEDSVDDCLLLLRELRHGGYEPIQERVDTPEEMRRALAERGPWDVVLFDWQMPRFSGAEALEMSREVNPEAPFIIVSGKVGEEAAVEAMKAGAHDYVMKDNLTRLCATVERGLEEAEVRRERERAVKSLQENEERFRSLVMNASDMITVFAPDGTWLYASPSMERVLGHNLKDIVGGSAFDLVHPDDTPRLRKEFAKHVRRPGTGRPLEFRARHADGSWRVLEAIGTNLLDNPSVGGLVFNTRDITNRKRDEETLERQARQEALRAQVSAALAGGGTLPDILQRCAEAMVTHLGVAFARLWILNEEEDVLELRASAGMYIHTNGFHGRVPVGSFKIGLIAQERQPYLTNDVLGDPHVHDKEWVQREGMVSFAGYPLIVEDRVMGVMAMFARRELAKDTLKMLASVAGTIAQGIQRKRAEEALVQSEERYRAVVEQAAEGILLFEAATGNILESNAAFQELLGYTAGELRGFKIHDLINDDRENIDRNIRLILAEGSRFLGERRYRRKDGSLMYVEAAASVIHYGGDKAICTVVRDVTERVEAFRMLEERVRALARISASLTVGQTMEATLDAVAARVVQSTAAVACTVVLLNAETGMPRTAGSHGLPEGYTVVLQAAYRDGLRPAAMEAIHTHRPMLVRDIRQLALNEPLAYPLRRFLRETSWDKIYCVPLVYRGLALGTINLYYLPGEEPSEDESVFLGAVADQAAVAVENARLFGAAQDTAALEERQRLARELHDSVSQALYGIILGTDAARTLLVQDPDRITPSLEYVLSLAKAGLAEMRALIFELRPESLATEGLIAALEKQAALVQARHELAVHLALSEDEPDAPLEVKEVLYRIAREALNNTVKHAQAERVELRLEQDADELLLEVCDDGEGFDPAGSFPGHLGLKSMRERVAHLGGTLRIESAPGEGARIRAQIPAGT
jgi:PAS domain S-box-containing protein